MSSLSTECARKATAEDFPRNFALIRLAERTLEKQKKEQEEKDKEERFNKDNMLYDEKKTSNKRLDLIKRMVRAHSKNVEKSGKAPRTEPLSAAEKRARKLEDLLSRWNSWKNLR